MKFVKDPTFRVERTRRLRFVGRAARREAGSLIAAELLLVQPQAALGDCCPADVLDVIARLDHDIEALPPLLRINMALRRQPDAVICLSPLLLAIDDVVLNTLQDYGMGLGRAS
jgi:hypothetical protein